MKYKVVASLSSLSAILVLLYYEYYPNASNYELLDNEGPPNVIVFLADDLGYGDLEISGHPTSRTPNINKLAENGKFLTNFYVTSPVCSPSRASLLTGRYQVRSGVYPGTFIPDSILGMPRNEITIANILKDKGYNTQMIGKWHLGVGYQKEFLPGNGKYGFDNYYGLPYSHDMCPCPICFPNNGSCNIPCWEGYVSCALFRNKEIIQQPVYLPTLNQRSLEVSLKFIKTSFQEKKSFFLYFPFFNIHHPQFASSLFVDKNARGPTGDALLEMDWMVGQIMDTLKLLHLDQNTLIWFTSDNGPSLQRHVFGGCAGSLRCGKGTTWDGGVRVPSIIHWPGKINPGKSNALSSTLDMLPTIASIVGSHLELKEDLILDGVDISSILLSDDEKSPREFYAVYPESPTEEIGPFAVIYKNYKAHFYTQGSDLSDPVNYDPMCLKSHNLTKHDPPLLYDLYRDPGERYDLGHLDKYKVILKTMDTWRKNHMSNMRWIKGRTQKVEERAQPCCTTPTCQPFPQCCDCKS